MFVFQLVLEPAAVLVRLFLEEQTLLCVALAASMSLTNRRLNRRATYLRPTLHAFKNQVLPGNPFELWP